MRRIRLVIVTTVASFFCMGSWIRADSIPDTSPVMKISGSDQYMEVPNSPSLNLTSGITVQVWAMFDGTEATPGMEINTRGNNNQGGYALGIHPPDANVPYSYGSGGAFGQFSTNDNAASVSYFTGGFHSFIWSYNGGVSDLYLDGSLIASENESAPIGTSTTDLFIGIGLNPDGSWNGTTADGYYDEIAIWNYGRTAAEIASTYDKSLTGNEAGLVGYWNFNSGNANDLTSYHNNGITTSGVQFVSLAAPLPSTFWSILSLLFVPGLFHVIAKKWHEDLLGLFV